MIDFNTGVPLLNRFLGSEIKTTLLYEGVRYMIKYPDPIREKNNDLSYMNNQFSEHIGCRIFSACGFEAQETSLGIYTVNGKDKIVVACRDFTQDGSVLYEFSKLRNAVITDDSNVIDMLTKNRTTIETMNLTIAYNDLITDKAAIITGFWDMFIIDALLGNSDRHFDNWGLLERQGKVVFAPIYDCGSTLAALSSDTRLQVLLDDPSEFKRSEFNITSCYSLNNKRIFYHEIFKEPIEELKSSLQRIVPRIKMEAIHEIVSSTEGITEIRKEYLIKALDMRFNQIILPAYKRL